jgi:methyl-accepting chemotaxis protein
MGNLKLKFVLMGVVLVMLGLFAGQGWLGLSKLATTNANVTDMATNWLPSVSVTRAMDADLANLRLQEAAHVMSTSDDEMTAIERDIAKALAEFAQHRKNYEPLISSAEERAVYERFLANWSKYNALHDRLISHSRKNENEAASALFKGEMKTTFDAAGADVDELVEINTKGANADYTASQSLYATTLVLTFSLLGGGVAAGLAAMVFVALGVSRPISRVTAAMQQVAAGNLTAEIPYATNRNEVGDIAKALDVFAKGLSEAERMRREQEQQKILAEQARKQEMLRLADDFERAVGSVVQSVVGASAQLETTAQAMSATTEEATSQSSAVAAASEQASSNVQTVAASSEELASSIAEISRQVNESAQVAARASQDADATAAKVRQLSSAAQKIGEVVDLISNVAGQTNLLALNATIEAARAGEAGRGFAVVAQEVKQLAEQTGKATNEIATQIGHIQSSTSDSVEAINQIAATIARMNHIASAIASAVEEQGAATREIARNVQEASHGTAEVNANISGVGRAVSDVATSSQQVLTAAQSLGAQSETLKREVATFLATVRAA